MYSAIEHFVNMALYKCCILFYFYYGGRTIPLPNVAYCGMYILVHLTISSVRVIFWDRQSHHKTMHPVSEDGFTICYPVDCKHFTGTTVRG